MPISLDATEYTFQGEDITASFFPEGAGGPIIEGISETFFVYQDHHLSKTFGQADVSGPDERVSAEAACEIFYKAELGISRSECFARAARSYLDELASHSLTQQIDETLQVAVDDSSAAAFAAGRNYLAG